MNHIICVFAVSNPIPSNLKSEAKKAAKILRDFTEISNRNGPDKLIPGKNMKTNCPLPHYTVCEEEGGEDGG